MLELEIDDESNEGSYVVDGCKDPFVLFNIHCTVGEACAAEGVRHRLGGTNFNVLSSGLEMLRSELY